MDKATLQKKLDMEKKRNAMVAAKQSLTDTTYQYESANLVQAKADSDAKIADLQAQIAALQ